MRKHLECELCEKTFRNRRALAGHMRLAHNVLMGEKQEIKDHLKQDGERLDKLTEGVEALVDDVENIKAMIEGLEKDLIEGEGEEIEEVVASNPLDVGKLKEDLKAEIKKELEEEKIKGEEERVKEEEEKRRAEEQRKKEEEEKEKKSIWL